MTDAIGQAVHLLESEGYTVEAPPDPWRRWSGSDTDYIARYVDDKVDNGVRVCVWLNPDDGFTVMAQILDYRYGTSDAGPLTAGKFPIVDDVNIEVAKDMLYQFVRGIIVKRRGQA